MGYELPVPQNLLYSQTYQEYSHVLFERHKVFVDKEMG